MTRRTRYVRVVEGRHLDFQWATHERPKAIQAAREIRARGGYARVFKRTNTWRRALNQEEWMLYALGNEYQAPHELTEVRP